MKATVTRAALAEAVQAVKGLVSKDALSAFSRVRLDASGCMSVAGTNGDVQVEWRLDGGTISDRGAATVPGAAFAAFVGAMPEGDVEIDGKAGTRVVLSGHGVVFRLSAGDAADYPTMAGPNDGHVDIDMTAEKLREMLRKVKFAASTDATRAILKGVNVHLENGMLSMTATDGRRLAHVEADTCAKDRTDVTLNTTTVAILYGLLDRMEDGDVLISFDGRAMRVVGGQWCLTTKVLAQIYPNWRRVVPEKLPHCATIKRTPFLDALERASLAMREENGVQIRIKDGLAAFAAKNDITSAHLEIGDVKISDGSECTFVVDPRILKDALSAIDDDTFTLHFDDGKSALKITCSVPWVAVVMPMRKES